MRFIDDKKEIDSYFVSTPNLDKEVESIISLQEEKKTALLVYSSSSIGKSHAFREKIRKKDGNKIIINFSKQSIRNTFPIFYLAKEIYDKLEEFAVETEVEFPTLPLSEKPVDLEKYYQNITSRLKAVLYSLKLDKPLYILINDIDLPFDNDFSLTFFKHFIFDKRELPNNLHVFLTTNSLMQVELNKEYLETVNIIGNKDNPKLLFKELMTHYGYKVNDEALLLSSPHLRFTDYLLISRFVVNYCSKDDCQEILNELLKIDNVDGILEYITTLFMNELSDVGRGIFSEALIDLYMFNLGLDKEQIVNSGRYLLETENKYLYRYNEISKEEKNAILCYIRYYTEEEGKRLFIASRAIREYIGSNANYFNKIISSVYEKRYLGAVDYLYTQVNTVNKQGVDVGKEIYLVHTKDRLDKYQLVQHAIYNPLCERLNETLDAITKYYKGYANYSFKDIDEEELFYMSYIERSMIIFKNGLRYDLVSRIIEDKYLMYFINSKSFDLSRRIMVNFLETSLEFFKRQTKKDSNIKQVISLNLTEHLYYLTQKEDNEIFERLRVQLLYCFGGVLQEFDVVPENINNIIKDIKISPINDFIETYADEEIQNEVNYIENQIKDIEFNDIALHLDFIDIVNRYENDEDVYHKLIYCYLAFKIYIELGENNLLKDKAKQMIFNILKDIRIYLEYCYDSSMFGMIEMYFGRFYPEEYLNLLNEGIYLLQRHGNVNYVSNFVVASKYFSTKKEGK